MFWRLWLTYRLTRSVFIAFAGQLFGYDVLISRTGYTGELGCEIYSDVGALSISGQIVADERVRPAGLGCRDTLRLEWGIPLRQRYFGRNHAF